jgi:hypothetical protein
MKGAKAGKEQAWTSFIHITSCCIQRFVREEYKWKISETYTFQQVQLNLHILRLHCRGKKTKVCSKGDGEKLYSLENQYQRGKFWFCSITHNCTWYAAGSPLACPASPNQQKPKPKKKILLLFLYAFKKPGTKMVCQYPPPIPPYL